MCVCVVGVPAWLQSLWGGSLEEFQISKVVYHSEDPPEEEVEEQGVEVDAADDRP